MKRNALNSGWAMTEFLLALNRRMNSNCRKCFTSHHCGEFDFRKFYAQSSISLWFRWEWERIWRTFWKLRKESEEENCIFTCFMNHSVESCVHSHTKRNITSRSSINHRYHFRFFLTSCILMYDMFLKAFLAGS